MNKKQYTCEEVSISHADLLELRQAGKLNLGIDNAVAAKISNTSGLGPKTTSSAAFHLWNWVAFIGFAYSIYLSFASNWWWFILGLFGAILIFRANKSGNAENVLDGAFLDADFYERIKSMNGWIYQIDEETAAVFKVSNR